MEFSVEEAERVTYVSRPAYKEGNVPIPTRQAPHFLRIRQPGNCKTLLKFLVKATNLRTIFFLIENIFNAWKRMRDE